MMEKTMQHTTFLQHHFADAEQQRESAKLGMWIFLVTEVLLFSGLFVFYAVYRALHPDMFINAHKYLDVYLGTINTVVLISSSVTVALAIRSLQLNKSKVAARYLLVTLLLAAVFLVVKYFEYHHKFELGQLPGKFYTFQGIEGTNPHVFFSIYFMMTGLHGLHVLGGMVAIFIMWIKTIKGHFNSEYYTPVENTGLYWHLVDLFWIYIFPLLYLIG
ncbi:cytochrome c oxidase subunit III [Caldithrix abyssi DSM 13497]|uniref:Cytochrome c oxidase subunit 3 n=1 Tax=Caldithrix abyssi DSM 13497 TaxID=880073 RepID=H1XPM7_CALAY|nr:cytochrome c oxidase subunit 3 family protein [Caldithrix abyssi]APF19852.1 cytochrome c oxidase subunit 3 [Caldithrix abyssi DSM 13497]EHO39948.1 cytochrome c oxidase subunit III [Caldithrix abyssi DSM 13497]